MMDANKNVTANLRGVTLLSPLKGQVNWKNNFTWTGASGASYYHLEVYNADTGALLFHQWLGAGATGCDTDQSCVYSPSTLATLSDGSYKWRVQYYAGGYGLWTPYMTFSIP
jgi:hypothetical protein